MLRNGILLGVGCERHSSSCKGYLTTIDMRLFIINGFFDFVSRSFGSLGCFQIGKAIPVQAWTGLEGSRR
jgi:hypothetical protein